MNITITQKEYNRLLERDVILEHLEGCGVDNWSEYSLPYCHYCDKIPLGVFYYKEFGLHDIVVCEKCNKKNNLGLT